MPFKLMKQALARQWGKTSWVEVGKTEKTHGFLTDVMYVFCPEKEVSFFCLLGWLQC